MTKEEAYLFFPVADEDDLQEVYEDRLFEYKQFFLTKPPVKRVFLARLEKLKKMDEAYRRLADLEESPTQAEDTDFPIFSDRILDAFSEFERLKGVQKQRIMQAKDAAVLEIEVRHLLELVSRYQQKWFREFPDEQLNVSNEPDAMELLSNIRSFEQEGGMYFDDITRLKSNAYLLNEMKRVSLLLKKFG